MTDMSPHYHSLSMGCFCVHFGNWICPGRQNKCLENEVLLFYFLIPEIQSGVLKAFFYVLPGPHLKGHLNLEFWLMSKYQHCLTKHWHWHCYWHWHWHWLYCHWQHQHAQSLSLSMQTLHCGLWTRLTQMHLHWLNDGSLVIIQKRLRMIGQWSGWGQSHFCRTCPGEPVVWFFQESSDFFRTTFGVDFENYA